MFAERTLRQVTAAIIVVTVASVVGGHFFSECEPDDDEMAPEPDKLTMSTAEAADPSAR